MSRRRLRTRYEKEPDREDAPGHDEPVEEPVPADAGAGEPGEAGPAVHSVETADPPIAPAPDDQDVASPPAEVVPAPAPSPSGTLSSSFAAALARRADDETAPEGVTAIDTASATEAEAKAEAEAEAEVGAEGQPAPESAARPPARRRIRNALVMAAIAGLAFVTGILLFNNIVMPRLIHGVGQPHVPDLSNLTLEQAEQALRPLNLQLSRAGERFDPAVPRGFVLSQDPSPGTAVRGGRRVSVVVSLGEEFSSVPELFGESQRSAEQLLRSAGLRVGVITRAPSDDVGDGLVAGSDPGPEAVLPRDATVSLLISTGASEETFVMPDLMGREIGGVRRQLEAHGLKVTPAGSSVGTIVSQSPPPGSRITRMTPITLQATGRIIR
jgi:serine/threonine-protein kinase